jgi:hypothetical protein
MYRDDNNTRFPPLGRGPLAGGTGEYGGGDPDPTLAHTKSLLKATNRPLWRYIQNAKTFECPSDRGADIRPNLPLTKSVFLDSGASYKYNANPWTHTKVPLADPVNGLAGEPESWIPEPWHHVLLQDLPALPWQDETGTSWYHSWHYPSGSVTTRGLKNFSKKAVAPVLFIDGRVQYFNLARHFRDNLQFPAEPTPDRVWYKSIKD